MGTFDAGQHGQPIRLRHGGVLEGMAILVDEVKAGQLSQRHCPPLGKLDDQHRWQPAAHPHLGHPWVGGDTRRHLISVDAEQLVANTNSGQLQELGSPRWGVGWNSRLPS